MIQTEIDPENQKCVVNDDISHVDQLIDALANNDVQMVRDLANKQLVYINATYLRKFEQKPILDEFDNYTIIEHTAKYGSPDMLIGLLDLPHIKISNNSTKHPFCVAEDGGRIIPNLWQHPKIINSHIYDSEYGQVTPVAYAYLLCSNTGAFLSLLQNPQLNIHAHADNGETILHTMLRNTYERHREQRDLLISFYAQLMIDKPCDIQKIFIAHPSLLDLLSKYKTQFWRYVQKQVYQLEPDNYYKLLKEIDGSEGHPLHTLFSYAPFDIVRITSSLFSSEPNVLDTIKNLLGSVDNFTILAKPN